MDKVIRWGAFIANAVLVVAAFIIIAKVHDIERRLIFSLLLLPPVLSLFALYIGPDIEERRLTKQVNKAKLRAELEKLGKK